MSLEFINSVINKVNEESFKLGVTKLYYAINRIYQSWNYAVRGGV